MRKISIALLFILIAAVVYIRYRPTITYISGKLGVKLSQIGEVSGSSVFQLEVPFHRQEHALSCEIASLQMALAGVGAVVAESELIESLQFDTTKRTSSVWGDPYKGFVGDIDGKMLSTGYGVYWDPIAKVGMKYRRTESLNNTSLDVVLQHVYEGRPVVVWGYFGRGNRISWQTPDGRMINAVNGEHARVLIGYIGLKENPTALILLDPIYGELHWDKDKFLSNWNALENGAVVVYENPRWVKVQGDETIWEISKDGTTRHGLSMDWETFVSGGGSAEAINHYSIEWLQQFQEGPALTKLD